MYVLDASVILKWFLEEVNSDTALTLKQKYLSGIINIAAPDLILYELANALNYQKSFPPESIYTAVESLIDLGIDIIVPTKAILRGAIEIAHKDKISLYDAAYISLAKQLGYCFITADIKLLNKIKEFKNYKKLSDLAL